MTVRNDKLNKKFLLKVIKRKTINKEEEKNKNKCILKASGHILERSSKDVAELKRVCSNHGI